MTGVLTSDDVTTVKTLWPKVYQQVCDNVQARLATIKHDLPQEQKNQLAVLLGKPLDASQAPDVSAFVQQAYQLAQQKKNDQAAQASESKLSNDYKTASDRLLG